MASPWSGCGVRMMTTKEVQAGLEGPIVTLLAAVVLAHLCSCGVFGLQTHGPAAIGSVGCLSVISHILENLSSVGVQKEGGPHMVVHVCNSSMGGGRKSLFSLGYHRETSMLRGTGLFTPGKLLAMTF